MTLVRHFMRSLQVSPFARVAAAAIVLLTTFSTASHAACDTGLAERMHAKLHRDRTLDHERAVCQPWRGVPGRFIVVLPLPRPGSEPDFTQFDLDVLVVQQADNGNTERATVISRLLTRNALTEDAVRIAEIKIDTARYNLAPNVRAFGVRIGRQGSSRVAPYANETLTLYVADGPKLDVVADDLEMMLESGEWDANCVGSFETVRASLSLAASKSNGYADLLLRRTRVATRSTAQGEECITHERPAKFETSMLRYDGKRYRAGKGTAD